MSDIGKVKGSGRAIFPSIRKSADPFQPEHGEMDYSQDLNEYVARVASIVGETEGTDPTVIREENRRKQYRLRKRKKKKENETENKLSDSDENLVDITA